MNCVYSECSNRCEIMNKLNEIAGAINSIFQGFFSSINVRQLCEQ